MSTFGSYARYYDLLYRDKDYSLESRFVADLIRKHAADASAVLELGCGTGAHACLLAESGFTLHGIDLSAEMLETGRSRVAALAPEVRERVSLSHGDVCNYRVDERFDAVISLFHVVSYQTSLAELHGMFETAAVHLRPGGVFVFDFWFAPAVLTQKPTTRVRRMESDEIQVTRIAEPVMHEIASCVDVNYEVFIRDKASDSITSLRETHRMRYLSLTEIEMIAARTGMQVLESCEWLTAKPPGLDTWGVCSVLRK